MVGHTTINVTYMFHSKLFAILEISEHTSISSTAQNICFLWQTVWRTDHCAQCKSGISCERLNDIEVCVCVCVCVCQAKRVCLHSWPQQPTNYHDWLQSQIMNILGKIFTKAITRTITHTRRRSQLSGSSDSHSQYNMLTTQHASQSPDFETTHTITNWHAMVYRQ